MLGLSGSAYIYQGEELGLPESMEVPNELREDPVYLRTGHKELGRDGCRIPLPWTHDAPGLGFGPSEKVWLPQPEAYAALAADQQADAEGSTLDLYTRLLHLRRERELGLGSLREIGGLGEDVVAYLNTGKDDAYPTLVLLNLGEIPVALPEGADLVVASGELTADGKVPTDTAIWARY